MNYYRCQEGTEAYHILYETMDRINHCLSAAGELAEELGAISFTPNELVVGGIGSLRFNHKPDTDAYRIVGKHRIGRVTHYDCVPCIDTKAGAEVAARIIKLPFIKHSDITERIGGIVTPEVEGDRFVAFFRSDGWIYLQSELQHRLEGLAEITEKNYKEADAYFHQ